MPYLIDGHNLIPCAGIDLHDPNDEVKLVHKLRGFAVARCKKCTVVFDGGMPGGRSRLSTGSVKVIFAPSHSNADHIIKQRIRKIPDARNWTLVSSDFAVQNVARRYGMQVMSSAAFAQRLQTKIQDPRGAADDAPVPADEVDEWLKCFGDD